MSQAKVDRYKEEKRNRAKLIRKEKREWMFTKIGLAAIAVIMIGWVGMSVYTSIKQPDENAEVLETYTLDTSALDEYISGLSAE